ncbi:hypothetical protein BZL30_1034 [Mycobacterium kansasii]|uniref:Uncharacterized protein n=1 Tax=Mycobacterium kansasii TaxID=1768 RepID=A0A1V3XTJ3_MYCKA|nr:hypothetical protein BZL30_1034 [Mycobacterium kansasii]
MSTPPEVRRLIDALAEDVYDAYYGIEYSGPQYSRGRECRPHGIWRES